MTTESGGVYRFTNVSAVVGGRGPISGYDDGTSISAAPQGDKVTYRKGNDGKGAFSVIAGDHWIVTISLLQNSRGIDIMDRWVSEELPRSLTVVEKGSGSTISGVAMPRQRAVVTYEAGLAVRSYDVHVSNATVVQRGFGPLLP